jgi:hypothetical protein
MPTPSRPASSQRVINDAEIRQRPADRNSKSDADGGHSSRRVDVAKGSMRMLRRRLRDAWGWFHRPTRPDDISARLLEGAKAMKLLRQPTTGVVSQQTCNPKAELHAGRFAGQFHMANDGGAARSLPIRRSRAARPSRRRIDRARLSAVDS